MKLTIKLFGPQAQLINKNAVEVAFDSQSPSVAQVRHALGQNQPALLDSLPVSRFAVNHEFADEQKTVTANDEIALIGLISGG